MLTHPIQTAHTLVAKEASGSFLPAKLAAMQAIGH